MDTIFKGDLQSRSGRLIAWVDALLVDHGVFRLGFANLAEVAPGRLYRTNHPTPGRLAKLVRRFGIQTLINLRGQAKNGSDALSRDAAARLGLDFVDMALESRGAPQRDRIVRLHGIYQTMRQPGLIHCKSGADRAGLAAALFILFEGGTADQALRQLSWRFGHVRASRTGILDAFFHRYAREGEGRKPFLTWVCEDYDEAALRRDFHANGLASFIDERLLHHE